MDLLLLASISFSCVLPTGFASLRTTTRAPVGGAPPTTASPSHPGNCPPKIFVGGFCNIMCKHDGHCEASDKCCPTGCGRICVRAWNTGTPSGIYGSGSTNTPSRPIVASSTPAPTASTPTGGTPTQSSPPNQTLPSTSPSNSCNLLTCPPGYACRSRYYQAYCVPTRPLSYRIPALTTPCPCSIGCAPGRHCEYFDGIPQCVYDSNGLPSK